MSVYTNALSRRIPFCTFHVFFRSLLDWGGLSRSRQRTVLYIPSAQDVFWRRGGVYSCDQKAVQGTRGGVD